MGKRLFTIKPTQIWVLVRNGRVVTQPCNAGFATACVYRTRRAAKRGFYYDAGDKIVKAQVSVQIQAVQP